MRLNVVGTCLGVVALVSLLSAERVTAQKKIVLATSERAPYAGENLREYGYVPELVTRAFERAGYAVEYIFLPHTRALLEAETGKVDGLVPSYRDKNWDHAFVYSNPFPGDHLGLLKKKTRATGDYPDSQLTQTEFLETLREYQFGLVRNISVTPEFDQATFLDKYYTTSKLSLVDMLAVDRVHFSVIDKYTAADIMVEQRPHLIGELEFIPLVKDDKPFHVAFSKKTSGHEQLRSDFNRSLQQLKASGEVAGIMESHGLYSPKIEHPEKTILTIGTVDNAEMSVMRELSKEFEKTHPEIQLDWRVNDEGTLRKRLLSDLAISDDQFDIMTIGLFEAHFWVRNNWLTPLTQLPENYDLNDVLQPFRDAVSYQEKLHALPFYGESLMTYYRKDLFEAAGIQMPDAPSYTQILDFADKIHNPQNGIYGLCLRGQAGWGSNMSYFNTVLNTHGGRWFDEQWNAQIETPEWRTALTFYRDMVTRYAPPSAPNNNFNENRELFSEGRCGIWVDATVAAGFLFDPRQSKVHDKVGFAGAPTAITPKGSRWIWSWFLAIPASSSHAEEAQKFITWATSKEYIKMVAERHGWLNIPPGTRFSSYSNENYQAVAPFSNFVLEAIQRSNFTDNTLKPSPYNGNAIVYIPEYPSIGYQVGLQLNKVIRGELSVDDALKASQELVSRQMTESGYTDSD